VQEQIFFATYSFEIHNQLPQQIDLQELWDQGRRHFSPWQSVPGQHEFASFTHLTGYSSNYYTYMLDKVIAVDFFDQFDKANLLDGPTALRYRHQVLEPGSTRPAAALVKDFLGRPQSVDALTKWMNVEFQTTP
jgi:thimet oligopeptidase